MNNTPKRKISEPTILNDNLRITREERGETQRDVAFALGMKDNKMISWYENTGAMPPYDKLIALARHYEVSMDKLFGLEKEIKNKRISKENILYNQDKIKISVKKVAEPTTSLTTRIFHIEADTLNKKRLDTLKILLENPNLLDNIAELLKFIRK